MKTIKLLFATAFVFVLSSLTLAAQSNENAILYATEITVKPGHNAQFVEGIKKWKACYLENKGQNKWRMWNRAEGDGNVYVMSGTMVNWAEMDKEDTQAKACYLTFVNFVMPHVEATSSRVSKNMPKVSRSFPNDAKYVRVTYYEVHKESAFEEVIEAVSEAIKKKEGDFRGLWFNTELGGPDTHDFMISVPFKKYADMDVKRDSPGKIYTDLVGAEKASELWVKWFDTLQNSWTYTYKLEQELSN